MKRTNLQQLTVYHGHHAIEIVAPVISQPSQCSSYVDVLLDDRIIGLYQAYREAEEILMRVTGRLHISVDRLYLNMAIAYEESANPNSAYDYFYKWYELCKDLYGSDHIKTRRPISTLNEAAYVRIAKERGVEVPTLRTRTAEE